MKEILEMEGYQVATAVNGKEAIDLLRTSTIQPRLVLLDMMMPVMDGIGFLKVIETDSSLAKIPVYIHSASADINGFGGAKGLLRKPATYNALMNLVQSYCH